MAVRGKSLATWGVALHAGLLIGLVSAIYVLTHTLSMSNAGTETVTDEMANNLATAMYLSIAGFLLALAGLILVLIALLSMRYRAAWFYKSVYVCAIIWLLRIPLGTVLGIILILFLRRHRGEFFPRPAIT
jgi:hypothetical protein